MPRLIKPGGVGISFTAEGVVEVDTSTCSHCQKITDVPDRRRMVDYVEVCRGCMKLVCLECYGKPCTPFAKKADIEEALHRKAQVAQMMGGFDARKV